MSTLQIDIYSDIACPWCFIGTRRLTEPAGTGAPA
jgi:predicted DsbA family dithiol-disulfide isomerase